MLPTLCWYVANSETVTRVGSNLQSWGSTNSLGNVVRAGPALGLTEEGNRGSGQSSCELVEAPSVPHLGRCTPRSTPRLATEDRRRIGACHLIDLGVGAHFLDWIFRGHWVSVVGVAVNCSNRPRPIFCSKEPPSHIPRSVRSLRRSLYTSLITSEQGFTVWA